MSSTAGHDFFHGTFARASDILNKRHSQSSLNCSHQLPATFMSSNSARNRIRSPLVLSTYHEDTLNSIHRKLLQGAHQRGSLASKAVLAANPASEVAQNFMLEGNSEVQVGVSSPLGSLANVVILVTNTERPLILHWGVIREREKQWSLPLGRPDGTTIYKNKALRTPFVKTGSNVSLTLEIDDPQVKTIEFLIFDEAENKWFKNNGQNFCVPLPKKDKAVTNLPIEQNFSVPEELVQIQAYLRWERKGKQVYSLEKEKEEYEAARRELLQEVTNGTSIEELWARLANKEDKHKKVPTTSFDKKIPKDLVQIQAYIRWEKAGKPKYSQDEQLREFEEAHKELQLELDKGVSIDEIRKKITKGEIQTKVSRKPFIVERIQRKKRDVIELINKNVMDTTDPGDGQGTAKALLDRIAELESEAERSFMHRFNIAADLTDWAKDSGYLGLAGILVWMRFMATRQLTWNKNYNVKPREISKAQDRLTDLLQNLYKTSPQYREIVRMIMSTVGRGGEGDVGQRIRDEILVIQVPFLHHLSFTKSSKQIGAKRSL